MAIHSFDAAGRASLPCSLAIAASLLGLCGSALAKGPAPDPAATALIAELGIEASPRASRELKGWRVPDRVVVSRATPELLERLRSVAPGVEIMGAAQGAEGASQLAGAQAVIGLCDAATLEAAPALHWIQTWYVGVESCVALPGLLERDIVLTNTQRTSGVPIAEHAIALTLALARGFPAYSRQQVTSTWNPDPPGFQARELTGGTMLLVGLGGIGTEIARRGHALGMRVIATRNTSREGPPFVAKVGLSDELLGMAAEADVIVNAAPLTPATTGLFDSAFFAAAKPGALFINVARGASVITEDLMAALQSGQIGGAGLDVTDPEPLPSDHPLWQLPNVIITPHVAADSNVQSERYVLLIAENLRRYVAGEPLLNVVDIRRGY